MFNAEKHNNIQYLKFALLHINNLLENKERCQNIIVELFLLLLSNCTYSTTYCLISGFKKIIYKLCQCAQQRRLEYEKKYYHLHSQLWGLKKIV